MMPEYRQNLNFLILIVNASMDMLISVKVLSSTKATVYMKGLKSPKLTETR